MKNPLGGFGVLSAQYVAGLFDGEGCVSSSKGFVKGKYVKYPRIRLQITIANTHIGLLQLLVKWFGGGYIDKMSGERIKPCYSWRVCGKTNMSKFLNYIKEYSIIKRKQIELGLEFCETLRDENLGNMALSKHVHKRREEIHKELRELKANGQ
jgi:hypothetical protein